MLPCSLARKLLLARLESLADRELTVGHMQGKFQVEVLRESSHCLHMDQPLRAAQALLPFLEAALAALPQHGGGGGGERRPARPGVAQHS
jgi:protein phosphatase methylesterase 1